MAGSTEKQLTEQQRQNFYSTLADRMPERGGGTSLYYDNISYQVGNLYDVTYADASDSMHESYVSILVAGSYFSAYEKKGDVLFAQYKAMWTAADNKFNGKDYVNPFGYKGAVLKKSHDDKVRG